MLALVFFCAQAIAQEDSALEESRRQAQVQLEQQQEAEEAERARQMSATQASLDAQAHERQRAEHEVDLRMEEAERRLAEAARQVADLSMAQLPRVERLERIIRSNRGPMLGVSIGSDENGGPVAGVKVLSVSPGGAAEEAGLRSGDIITSINKEALTAESSQQANARLLDFMQGVEDGDTLDVEYLRDGKSNSTRVAPRPMDHNVFAFGFDGDNFNAPNVRMPPNGPPFGNFIWRSDIDGFGAMELAPLSERLGSYFGTNEGLLVVSAPGNEDLQLQDGDVILNIDGRRPTSVAHAMRILGSYESGEELEIEIMRDKRKRTIKLEIPDNRRSSNGPGFAPQPPMAIREKVVVVDKDGI
jgi:C-terminal processing protease CtpA/Prc